MSDLVKQFTGPSSRDMSGLTDMRRDLVFQLPTYQTGVPTTRAFDFVAFAVQLPTYQLTHLPSSKPVRAFGPQTGRRKQEVAK